MRYQFWDCFGTYKLLWTEVFWIPHPHSFTNQLLNINLTYKNQTTIIEKFSYKHVHCTGTTNRVHLW